MKKKVFRGLLVALAGLLLSVGTAFAELIPNDAYPLINPGDMSADYDTMLVNIQKYNDFGVFIWTDDTSRTKFNIAWTADKKDSATFFQGNITFQDVTQDNIVTIAFEKNDMFFNEPGIIVSYFSLNNGGIDGLSFDLTNWQLPSYLGFNISIGNDPAINDAIFFGAFGATSTPTALNSFLPNDGPVNGKFALAAPVPEPATMLLFGTGLIGLIGVTRRRIKKN